MATELAAPETALVLIESLPPIKLFEPGTIDPILERIKTEVRAVETDISTEAGRKAIASLAFKVARSKTFIDAQRKSLVADEKKRLAAIDKEGARIWGELESLQHEVRKPLTDWENAEKERVTGHESALAEIMAAGPYSLQNWQTLSIEAMQDRISEIQNDPRNWEEFARRAEQAKKDAVTSIEAAIAKRTLQDEERKELERLRKEAAEREQKKREEAIAAAAREEERTRVERESREREETERAAKEKAIREKQAAEARAAKAEADRIAAEQRAKAEQEAAIQRERDRVEAEKRAVEAAEAKREENKRHVAKINKEAATAFLKGGFDMETAKAIVALIAKGEIPHVRITY